MSSVVSPAVTLLMSYALIRALDKRATKDMEVSSASLRNAARRGETETVAILLREGADVEVQDLSGMTPLMHAAAQGRFEAAQILLQYGAVASKETEDGKTALSLAEEAKIDAFTDILWSGWRLIQATLRFGRCSRIVERLDRADAES